VTWKPIVVWTGSTVHVPVGMSSVLVVMVDIGSSFLSPVYLSRQQS
jgi:hypothetical protein